jgi:hypothetical protein
VSAALARPLPGSQLVTALGEQAAADGMRREDGIGDVPPGRRGGLPGQGFLQRRGGAS